MWSVFLNEVPLLQELVFGKKFDHGVKQSAKQGGAAELVFEQEPVKEAWQKITNELAKESEERKTAASQLEDAQGPEEEEEPVSILRKPPSSFELHSAQYWKSVANQAVRTYVTLCPEPKTLSGVVEAVAQSNVKNIAGTQGESSVVLFLDMDSLGESQGPGQQPYYCGKSSMWNKSCCASSCTGQCLPAAPSDVRTMKRPRSSTLTSS